MPEDLGGVWMWFMGCILSEYHVFRLIDGSTVPLLFFHYFWSQ